MADQEFPDASSASSAGVVGLARAESEAHQMLEVVPHFGLGYRGVAVPRDARRQVGVCRGPGDGQGHRVGGSFRLANQLGQ
jgi:hypothetical protein